MIHSKKLANIIAKNLYRRISPQRQQQSFARIQFKEAKDGRLIDVEAPMGKTLLDIAIDHNIDIEGACGGI